MNWDSQITHFELKKKMSFSRKISKGIILREKFTFAKIFKEFWYLNELTSSIGPILRFSFALSELFIWRVVNIVIYMESSHASDYFMWLEYGVTVLYKNHSILYNI